MHYTQVLILLYIMLFTPNSDLYPMPLVPSLRVTVHMVREATVPGTGTCTGTLLRFLIVRDSDRKIIGAYF
jgi:hypothetical protein